MTFDAPCRCCGGKPAKLNGHHVPRHRAGCRYVAKVQRRRRHGRAPFRLANHLLVAFVVWRLTRW